MIASPALRRMIWMPLTLVAAAATAGPSVGQTAAGGDAEPALEQLIRRLYVEGQFHGGILIAEGEDVLLQEAWGVADHDLGAVLTPEHRFTLNSLGKMFTAILIMQLVEEGTLALDDPLSRHFPAFEHPRASEVTIHMLLAHRSGIADYFLKQLNGEIPPDADAPALLAAVSGMALDFEPGTMFHYSNTGYLLLGLILEQVYGKPYSVVVAERIFQPLRMAETVHYGDGFRRLVPNYYTQSGEVIDGATLQRPHAGDGGTSSLRDLHRFMLALGSEQVLRRESWDLMFTPHSLPTEVPEGAWPPPHRAPYGYGFSLLELPYAGDSTALAVGHGGAGLGSNHVVRFLDSKRIVITWNNIFKPPFLMDVFQYLAGRSPPGARE